MVEEVRALVNQILDSQETNLNKCKSLIEIAELSYAVGDYDTHSEITKIAVELHPDSKEIIKKAQKQTYDNEQEIINRGSFLDIDLDE